MTTKSLWRAIDDMEAVRPPYELIQEQSEHLVEMTKNLLELKVERKQSNTIFNYDGYIHTLSLNTKQRILRLTYNFKLYPANLYDEDGTREYRSKTQEEFEENLGKILSSKETMTTIGGLLTQARLEGSDILV